MSVLLQYSVHKDLAKITETTEQVTRYIVQLESENRRLREENEELRRTVDEANVAIDNHGTPLL